MAADLIIENARVLTQDPASPRAEAIAIAGNRIVRVGAREDMAALKGPTARIIDAGGATVLPGFIESHMHVFAGSVQLDRLSLAGIEGIDAITTAIRRRAAEKPDEAVILVEQAQYGMFDGAPITRQKLDQILPDRPLALWAGDHHTMWANTAALERTGLIHGKALPVGNEIVMGADGKAAGELREFLAYEAILALTPNGGRDGNGLFAGRTFAVDPGPAARDADTATLRKGLAYLARHGITSFHNMDGDPYQFELLKRIDDEGGLPVRARVPLRMLPDHPVSDLELASGQWRTYRSDRLSGGFIKMFMDGVGESTTAWMLDDYGGHPGVRGAPLFDLDHFNAICIEADRRGLQIAVHAIGDAAVRATLDGYEAALKANGRRDSRHRIEHVEALDPADLPRFAALGVVASMQPTHAPGDVYPMEPMCSLFGEKRLRTAYAWGSLRRSGAPLCFASDWPVAPIDPMLSIKAAVTRRKLSPNAAEERQTLDEALAGYTRDGAWVEFAEDRKGMLKPGYLADVVMLDGDIEATAPEAIDSMTVRLTICDGRITHQA